jgi:TonB family protein
VSDKPPAPNPVPSPPKQATGAQLNKGSALIETGAKGNEIGLASGGAGNNSAEIDSCCKAFFNELLERVDQRWQRNQSASGVTIVEFTIERDGTISASHVATTSGNDVLDLAAWSAVKNVQKLSPIPDEYKGKRMTILLRFPYNR